MDQGADRGLIDPPKAASPERDSVESLDASALRIFFNLAQAWKLDEQEEVQLLAVQSASTLSAWKAGVTAQVGQEMLQRISYLIGIFKGINTLLPVPERADAWMRKPNASPPFNGASALEKMAAGDLSDLKAVRQYLDAQLV